MTSILKYHYIYSEILSYIKQIRSSLYHKYTPCAVKNHYVTIMSVHYSTYSTLCRCGELGCSITAFSVAVSSLFGVPPTAVEQHSEEGAVCSASEGRREERGGGRGRGRRGRGRGWEGKRIGRREDKEEEERRRERRKRKEEKGEGRGRG